MRFNPIATKAIRATFQSKLRREDGFGHALSAKKIEGDQLKIFFVSNAKKNARLGIVVRKKLFPTAVERNRNKRIIREAFRRHAIRFIPLDLVVLVKLTDEKAGLYGKLEKMFSELEIRCADL